MSFESKIDKSGECWLWIAATNDSGYGVVRIGGRLQRAHRVAYETEHGPIPPGLMVDHKCRTRACVRVAHLQLVTNKVNQENRQGAQANSKSGVRGVHWFKPYGKWRVEVAHNGRRHHGGYFTDLDEAAKRATELRNSLFTNNLADRAKVSAA